MYTHQVEPVVLLRAWLEEFDLSVSERPKEPLISDITHAI